MLHAVWAAIFLACITSAQSFIAPNSSLAFTRSGLVQGSFGKSKILGRNFRSFLSIPYAKPPVGDLRFAPPEPVEPWIGVFNADRVGVKCVQFGPYRDVDTEDCLVLNVYTPATQSVFQPPLPVIVVIHGGAYVTGSGSFDDIKPFKFMDYDVVMVTINYRLGILGFLNTEDESSPGNYGMLDQVLALHWVQKNIEHFGGDPSKVTIMGNSAGGASVSYHTLSPLSKGLFHAAIDESGSPLNPWAFQTQPLRWARKAANLTKCPQEQAKDFVACLKTKTTDELFNGRRAEIKIGVLVNIGPSIDVKYGKKFLIDAPKTLLSQGKINRVPMIAGYAHDEGSVFVTIVNAIRQSSGQAFLDNEFCFFLAAILDVNLTPTVISECAIVVQEYFGGLNANDPAVLQAGLVKVFGDVLLIAGISKSVELYAKAGVELQAYVFDYLLDYSNTTKATYTEHGDEITLLFDSRYTPQVIPDTVDNLRMSKILDFIWTHFAIKGQNSLVISTPEERPFEWPLYNMALKNYVSLDFEPQALTGILCDKTEFWDVHIPIIKGDVEI